MQKFIIRGTSNNNSKNKTLLHTNVDFREVYASQNVKQFVEISTIKIE